ncbi:MAG: hypothetical protein ACI9MF_000703 [Gammaproteobacteria bacterium]
MESREQTNVDDSFELWDLKVEVVASEKPMICVAAVIVGARYAERLPKLLRAFDTHLSETDREEIARVIAQSTGPAGPVFALERDITGRHGQIMKYNLNSGDTSQLRDALPNE